MSYRTKAIAAAALSFAALATIAAPTGSAVAADLPVKAPHIQSVFDWTGLYVGGHAGFSRSPNPRRPVCGTCGSTCMRRPMP